MNQPTSKFDGYQKPAQMYAAIVSVCSMLDRSAAAQLGRASRDALWPAWIRQAQKSSYKSNSFERTLADLFFHPRNDSPVSFDRRGRGTFQRMQSALRTFLDEDVLAKGRPLRDLVDAGQASDDRQRLFERLTTIASERGPATLEAAWEGCKTLPPRDFLAEILQGLFGRTGGPHPDFPCVDLLDPRAVKAECHGPPLEGGAATDVPWGAFAILREARGWEQPDPRQANRIVRDLLWLYPRQLVGPRCCGFYVSVVDGGVFRLETLQLEADDQVVYLVGQLESRPRPQHCKIVLGRFSGHAPLEQHRGLIAGLHTQHAGPAFAAWKILAVRPNWRDLERFDAFMAQLTSADRDLVLKLAREMRFVADLYSTALAKDHPAIEGRREALRRLFSRGLSADELVQVGGFLGREFKALLTGVLGDFAERSALRQAQPAELVDQAVRTVFVGAARILSENWAFIDPAQLSVSGGAVDRAGQSRETKEHEAALRMLLDRTTVFPP